MRKVLVEMYERDGAWWLKDDNNLEWSISLGTATPLEAKNNTNLKVVKKLKQDGFSTDEIIELFKEKIL